MTADQLNRPSANPGGMECQTCGRIFIGDESHSECGLCHNTRPTAVASHADGEVVARRFHEAYERLAPSFGYETRQETREFDPTSPNGRLMIAVCNEVMSNPPRSGDEAGHVVVTRDSSGEIVAVTRQDADGQILSVIAEKFTDDERRKFAAEHALTNMSVQDAMAARGGS